MRAAAVRKFRAPVEVLDLPAPPPEAGEVEVRIEAAGMNPFDWKIADGGLEGRPHVFPLVLGVDGCGVVERVGAGVRGFRAGDRVVGSFLHDPVGVGTYAERSRVPERNALVRVPESVAPDAAAALPTAGMTALQALDSLAIAPGGHLLIVGASGGVGSFAVQLAHARGLLVTAVARAASHERLRSLGARDTLEPIPGGPDGRTQPPNGVAFEGLLDLVSDRNGYARWCAWLRPGAAAASSVGAAHPLPGLRPVAIDMQPSARDLGRLLAEVEAGRLAPAIERRIRLEQVPAAIAESRAGRSSGKTVIVL